MVQEKNLATIEPGAPLAPVAQDQFTSAIVITPEYVERTKQSLTLLRGLVNDVLVEGRDYGTVPGIGDEFLWEPGASQIIGSFNCHTGPARLIKEVDDGQKISVVMEVPLISFLTGQEVGCGVGAASTLETKHKYRWLRKYELADWGFESDEAIKALKTKEDRWHNVLYRIMNPEHDELINTIWKMAFKRGKVAAAKGLPGVSSALVEKFNKKQGQQPDKKKTDEWAVFWAEMRQRGLTGDQVHGLLKVHSIKDYVKDGKTPADARAAVDKALAQQKGTGAGGTGDAIDVLCADLAWTAKDLIGAAKYLKLSTEKPLEGTIPEIYKTLNRDQQKTLTDYMQKLAEKKSGAKNQIDKLF